MTASYIVNLCLNRNAPELLFPEVRKNISLFLSVKSAFEMRHSNYWHRMCHIFQKKKVCEISA